MLKKAAFFDLDGTLLTVNSATLWLKRERRLGRIDALTMAKAVVYLLGYKFGAVDMERGMARALESIRGEREETVRGWTREWFHDEVEPHVAPGSGAILEQHREQGHLTVLLTSSSNYEAELATELFGLDAYLATRYEVVDGQFTGRFNTPLCYGEGKVFHAERFARDQGLDLDSSYFYTDSITDLPMLLRVGQPRAVNPDLRLRWAAWRRHWPCLDWRT